MKKILTTCCLLLAVCSLGACCNCPTAEPIVAENAALITPPGFGKQPN
ncbi:MAG: hypothetical protein LBR41_01375 [Rickettsiales bacterium]|nr:hypothetical protein [Rickettsiales bacterium]